MTAACATCASIYGQPNDPLAEKPLMPGRKLECCARSICSRCLNSNGRFETYCPYCQISSAPSVIPKGGLREPPAYSTLSDLGVAPPTGAGLDEQPPAYDSHATFTSSPSDAKGKPEDTPDVLHFVTQKDSMTSLALAYGVPINVLRKVNNVYSDHLLQGRRTVLIPGAYYKTGISLSPRPTEGEEEERRKQKIRKWMMACKVADYDVALLYLDNAAWNLNDAIDAHNEDEQWEKEHPLKAKGKRKEVDRGAANAGRRRFLGDSSSAGRER